jgi:hypothetical protein
MMCDSRPNHGVIRAKAGAHPEVPPFVHCWLHHLRMGPGLRRDDIAFVETFVP